MEQKSKFLEIAENTPIPDFLYHYASSDGLMGILDTKKIWTTKIHYLNDSSELTLGLNYIRDEIKSQRESNSPARSTSELDELSDVLSAIEGVNLSVVSFTENGDQLSQWRGYTDVGNGYSLGFDGNKLNDHVLGRSKDGYFFIPCIYDKKDQKLLAKELVNHGKVIGHSQKQKQVDSPFQWMEFKSATLLVASMIKSDKFMEEREWRLVTPIMSYKDAEFRQGKYSLLPYWKFEILLDKILKKIIIGPTLERNLSYEALRGLLIKHYPNDFQKIEITNSEVPYRNV